MTTNCIPCGMRSGSLSTHSSISGDEGSDKSQAIPNSLIKEQWQLILGQESTVPQLKDAIERCRELVLASDECSSERKWLVRHLVELRFRVQELEESEKDPQLSTQHNKVILGHHFAPRNAITLPPSRQYCDNCSGIIWSVLQASYICQDCSFVVHHKCVENISRICAHVVASERKYPIADICPEVGIAGQSYKCCECKNSLTFKRPEIEARLCDYSGLYYCSTCHWNDVSIIPARVVHNWDFTPRKVSRASLQEINLILEKPVINLEERNPKLFAFVQELDEVKKMRQDLGQMRRYISECRIATESKFIELNVANKRHLMQTTDVYSISDLVQIDSGGLIEFLTKLFQTFDKHIRSCEICSGKGYICEICKNKEALYPYDAGSIPCSACQTLYHRSCWARKNFCGKCDRLQKRKEQLEKGLQDEQNGN